MTQLFRDFINFIKAAFGNGTITEDHANNWIFVLTAIALSFTILSSLWKLGSWIAKWRKRKMLINDLAPYYTKADIYQATTNYIPTKYQNVAPSEDDEPGRTYIASAKDKMIPLFLNLAFNNDKDDNKYYLVLADAGMGKTTFMINLYLAYKRQWKWWNRRYDIKVLPLGHPQSLKDLEEMDKKVKENTIILLDALDEDSKAVKDYQKRMQEVLDVAWRFRAIVITCRTQFFPSKKEEPTTTGYFKFGGKGGEHNFQKLYISVFDNRDITRYLLKRFRIWNPLVWKKLRKARKIVKKSPNLVMRPMLLSHIEDLVEQDKEFKHTFEIYEVMIEKWIEREAEKPHIKQTYGSIEKFKEQLFAFSQSLAVNLYLNQSKRGGFYISTDEKIDSDSGIQLSDLEANMEVSLKESGWRSRSLLNRNAEGYYKFSHKSILEYFLAKEAIENPSFSDQLNFEGLDTALRFRNEMFIVELWKVFPLILPESKTAPDLLIDRRDMKPSNLLGIRSANIIIVNALRFVNLDGHNEILLINSEEYPSLYLLYIHFYLLRARRGQLGLLELQEPRVRLELQELQEMRELLVLLELQELQVRLNQLEVQALIKELKLHEQLERLEKQALQDLQEQQEWEKLQGREEWLDHLEELKQIKARHPDIILELRQANEFIKQCQALEKKWPKIKFIY